MQKKMTKLTALLLASMIALSGCGGGSNGNGGASADGSGEEITELALPVSINRELETFNILYSQRGEDSENLTNLVDGLLSADPQGKLVPAIAESWETTDGGETWTFHLRDGVKWVNMNGEEMADCNAKDFAAGLEWILNFHKNGSSNTSMPIEMIKGAAEYYEYTKGLDEAEAQALNAADGSKFLEMVGIEVPDDNTVIYHCTDPKPYFDSVASYVCLFPMAQGMIDELGGVAGVKAMDNKSMWYNGGYTMTTYVQNNEKVLTQNPTYWDKDCHLFDTVTVKMVEPRSTR